jgi:hypothetical protein
MLSKAELLTGGVFVDNITPSVIFASKNASSLNEGAVDIRR